MKNVMQNEHVKDMLKTGSKLFKVWVYVGVPLTLIFFIFVLIMILRVWHQIGLI